MDRKRSHTVVALSAFVALALAIYNTISHYSNIAPSITGMFIIGLLLILATQTFLFSVADILFPPARIPVNGLVSLIFSGAAFVIATFIYLYV